MKDSYSWLTPKQAGELAGYSARHIQNLIVAGKLTATKEDGKYFIDKAEFFRVFPKAHRKEQEGNTAQREAEKQRLEFENDLLKEVAANKDKEIEFLRSQVIFVSHEKEKMLDALVGQTRLLEHKQKKEDINVDKKDWKRIFRLKKD
jgi:hypothetical protein